MDTGLALEPDQVSSNSPSKDIGHKNIGAGRHRLNNKRFHASGHAGCTEPSNTDLLASRTAA
jgi:hypothetical protein